MIASERKRRVPSKGLYISQLARGAPLSFYKMWRDSRSASRNTTKAATTHIATAPRIISKYISTMPRVIVAMDNQWVCSILVTCWRGFYAENRVAACRPHNPHIQGPERMP